MGRDSAGDRYSSSPHDHVILPKRLTDDFYATWTHCYEELFQASLSDKYVAKSSSALEIFGNFSARLCDDGVKTGQRISLDVTDLQCDERLMGDDKAGELLEQKEKSNLTKLLSAFSGRRRMYRLTGRSQTTE